jgi:hypothetical protein
MLLARVMRRWWWDVYDHMVMLLVGNVVALVVLAIVVLPLIQLLMPVLAAFPAPLQILALGLLGIVLLPPATALCLAPGVRIARRLAAEEEATFGDLLTAWRRDFGPCWRFSLLFWGVVLMLALNLVFYTFLYPLPGALRPVGFVLSGLFVWALVLVMAFAQLCFPLWLRGGGLRAAARAAALLGLRHPVPVLASLFLCGVLLWVSSWMNHAPMVLMGCTAPFLLWNALVLELEEAEAARTRTALPAATSWREREDREQAEERRRARSQRYERTLRDLLRPWQE